MKITALAYLSLLLAFLSLNSFYLLNQEKVINNPIRASPTIFSNPNHSVDSTKYSIQIEGSFNEVRVNDKLMKTTQDSIPKKNDIQVKGEGNTVIVKQDEKKSEVIITQNGNNNQVKITQK